MFGVPTSPIKTVPTNVFVLLAHLLLLLSSTHAANLASDGTASQSSEIGSGGGYPARYGNNGDLTDFTHTAHNTPDEWWRVDLTGPAVVDSIIVHNRNHNNDAVTSRLSFALLQILGDDDTILDEKELPDTSSTTNFEYSFTYSGEEED